MTKKRFCLRDAARLLPLPWAAWWIYFAVASRWSATETTSLDNLFAMALAAAFSVSAALVWVVEVKAAALLVAEGLVVVLAFPILSGDHMTSSAAVFVVFVLGLPPLLAGGTLLWLQMRPRNRRPA